jgi:hypothetical protein
MQCALCEKSLPLNKRSDKNITDEIEKLQSIQKKLPATSITWEQISDRLTPLFAEMAKRTRA